MMGVESLPTSHSGLGEEAWFAPLFRAVVEQAPLAVSITDLSANILYCNPAFNQVTGYTSEEMLGHNESRLSDKSTPSAVYRDLWQTINMQRIWRGQLVNRRKDGSRYLAEVAIAPVLGEDGATSHYLGMHRDITVEHALDKQVQNQKALIESMINAAPQLIALLDEEGGVVLDNLAYKTLRSDLGGLEIAESIITALDSPLSVGRDFKDLELRLDDEAGTRWFVCDGNWLREQDVAVDAFFEGRGRNYLMLHAREVTERKHHEEQRRRNALSASLAEEAQTQAMSQAIEGASYQLKGPLNMLNAALAMAERRGADESLKQVLHEALSAGAQALETLEKAHPDHSSEQQQWVSLRELIAEVVEVCAERLKQAGVSLDSQGVKAPALIRGDGARLRGVVKQLIDNAMEAMLAAGTDAERRRIRIALSEVDGCIKLSVEDGGPGVDEALRLRVFQPFFSSHEGHSGMGLAWVQDVINKHAGTISLENTSTGGCRVCVVLPLLTKGAEQ